MAGLCPQSTFLQLLSCNAYLYTSVTLVIICLAFNWWIDRLYARGYTDITAWLVVAGTSFVIIGYGVVRGVEAAIEVFVLFSCAGLVMVIGAMRRNAQMRDSDIRELTEAVDFNQKGKGE